MSDPNISPDLFGTSGDDTLAAVEDAILTVAALGGDDLIYGAALAQPKGARLYHLYGGDACAAGAGSGNDTIRGANAEERIFGQDGNDLLFGGEGEDEIYGGDGDDTIGGGVGLDRLFGGEGRDLILLSRLSLPDLTHIFAELNGGAGFDRLSFRTENAVDLFIDDYSITDIEAFEGGQRNDTIFALDGVEELGGREGDDVLHSADAATRIVGGSGSDTASFRDSRDGVSVFLDPLAEGRKLHGRFGTAEGDELASIENLTGSDAGADDLRGDFGANMLRGLGGDDVLRGRGGDDNLRGGDGRDSLQGDAGADTLNGGDHDDFLTGGAGSDDIRGGDGVDTANWSGSGVGVSVWLDGAQGVFGAGGHAAGDKLTDIENLRGSYHGDMLHGDGGDNRIDGLFGDDYLAGGAGADTLIGAQGDDTLEGGEGADAFVFNAEWHAGSDTIVDYEEGVDVIEIHGEAETEILPEEWGVEVIIQGPELLTLTVKGAWEIDLIFMG